MRGDARPPIVTMTKRAFSLACASATTFGACCLAVTVAAAAVEAVPLPNVNPKRPPDINAPSRNPSRAVAAVEPAISTPPQAGSPQPAPAAQLAKATPEASAADALGLSAPMLEPEAEAKAAERRMAAALKPLLG